MLYQCSRSPFSIDMEPTTAAGIGLAVVSLAAQCFLGTMQGTEFFRKHFGADKFLAIQLISSARNLEPEYKYLTVRLRLEQQRLYNWSLEVGLIKYLEDEEITSTKSLMGMKHNTVLDTLEQLYGLALGFVKCKDKYAHLVPDEDDKTHSQAHDALEWGLNRFPDLMLFLKKPRSSVSLIQGLPKRLKWAGFYRDRYEELINRFRDFNDTLIDLVDSDARVAIRESTRETNTTILHLHTKIDELVTLTKALMPETPTGSANSSPTASHLSDFQQKDDLLRLAYFKAVSTTVEDNSYFASDYPEIEGRQLAEFKIGRSDIQLYSALELTSDRSEAEYHPLGKPRQRVWIEWRECDPIFEIQPNTKPSRIDKLVALLSNRQKPDLLRVPNCIGYFDDPERKENDNRRSRLGFVFEKPTNPTASPISLRDLLKTRSKPLLTERVALAKVISKCLMSLHSVNWLHKSLRSHNIIFFPEAGNTINYSCPYLSGFGYARPTFREDMTEIPSQNPEYDMYRHPRTHSLGPWEGRQGFKRTFDIYSLGVVLVEIANWETIDEVLKIADPSSLDDATLAGIQRQLLEKKVYMKNVGANAGVRFRNATLSCLDSAGALDVNFLDDETNALVAAKLSQNFHHRVIKPLEEIQT